MRNALGLALVLMGLLISHGLAKPVPKGPTPAELYGLRFLGCEAVENEAHSHNGLFVLTWKGDFTKIRGYLAGDGKTVTIPAAFRVHDASGWQDRGDGCLSCTQWLEVQPRQVINIKMDLAWLEKEMPGAPSHKGFDKGRLLIGSKEGILNSDDFPLPLVVPDGK